MNYANTLQGVASIIIRENRALALYLFTQSKLPQKSLKWLKKTRNRVGTKQIFFPEFSSFGINSQIITLRINSDQEFCKEKDNSYDIIQYNRRLTYK